MGIHFDSTELFRKVSVEIKCYNFTVECWEVRPCIYRSGVSVLLSFSMNKVLSQFSIKTTFYFVIL